VLVFPAPFTVQTQFEIAGNPARPEAVFVTNKDRSAELDAGVRTRGVPPLVWWAAAAAFVAVLVLGWMGRRGAAYIDDGLIAMNLLAGRGYVLAFHGPEAPTAAHAPLEPCVLYGLHALFGIGPASVKAIVFVRALFHALLPLCAWPLARRVAGLRAATIACIVMAFEPSLLLMAGNTAHLDNRVTLSLPFMLLAVVAILRSLEQAGWWRCFAAGLVTGAAALSEPLMLPFALAPLAMLVWGAGAGADASTNAGAGAGAEGGGSANRSLPARRRWLLAASLLAGIVVMIGPWCVRNRLVLGRWVPVRTSFGLLFWVGNNPVANGLWVGGEVQHDPQRAVNHRGAYELVGHPTWFNFVARDTLDAETLHAVETAGEAGRDRILMDAALRFIAAHPLRFLDLSLHRAWWFVAAPPHRAWQQSDGLADRVVHTLRGPGHGVWWAQHAAMVDEDLWSGWRAIMAVTFLTALLVIVLRPTLPLSVVGALLLTWLVVFGMTHAGYGVYRFLLSPFVIVALAALPRVLASRKATSPDRAGEFGDPLRA